MNVVSIMVVAMPKQPVRTPKAHLLVLVILDTVGVALAVMVG